VTFTEFISAIGLCFGLAGFILGVLNYLRDRHRISITLQWDLSITPGSGYDHTEKWGVVRVTNVGRRPSFISHVALKLPKGYDHSHLVIMGGISGKKLSEGDPTEVFMVTQEGMEKYAKDWKRLIAQVNDAAGKTWYSKRLKANQRPSWAMPSR
jgi:hypothetical protein